MNRYVSASVSCTFLLLLLALLAPALAQQVTLSWRAGPSPEVTSHRIYRAPHPDSTFELLGSVPAPLLSWQDMSVRAGQLYYYAVTAVRDSLHESGFSNIVVVRTALATSLGLLSLSGDVHENSVVLEWSVGEADKVGTLEVERRSGPVGSFDTIGQGALLRQSNGTGLFRFVDSGLTPGVYTYRLKGRNPDGQVRRSDDLTFRVGQPGGFSLAQNYPNPFNPETAIRFTLAEPRQIRLDIFDINGKRVLRLVGAWRSAGEHRTVWDGRDESGTQVPSGMYYYRLSAGERVLFRRMTLLR